MQLGKTAFRIPSSANSAMRPRAYCEYNRCKKHAKTRSDVGPHIGDGSIEENVLKESTGLRKGSKRDTMCQIPAHLRWSTYSCDVAYRKVIAGEGVCSSAAKIEDSQERTLLIRWNSEPTSM